MLKVKIFKVKPAIEFLINELDNTDYLPQQIKISKVISYLQEILQSVGIVIESYKKKFEGPRLELKIKNLSETETEYDGPQLTMNEIDRLSEITADNLLMIDFLVKDW